MKRMAKALGLLLAFAGVCAFLFWERKVPPVSASQAQSASLPPKAELAESEAERREISLREQDAGQPQQLRNIELLLSEPMEALPDLCRLRCEQVGPALGRMQQYQSGASPPTERDDPAYLLAKLLFQRAMGSSGKAMIKMMVLFQDPSWVRALALRPRDLAEMVVAFGYLEDGDKQLSEQAKAADAYVESLRLASSSCEERTWPDTCRGLEQRLADWGRSEI